MFAKGYGFLSFAQNMGKNFDKIISKNLSGKNLLITLKNLQQMRLKLLQKEQFNLID